jgi:hypothetical protein
MKEAGSGRPRQIWARSGPASSLARPVAAEGVRGPPDRPIRKRALADRHHPRRPVHARARDSSG